jgi:GT2 family glycosyltransferase
MVKVVVVTPVLNQLFYTKMFLRSLEGQSLKDFAVVVVNNASTDDTAAWLETSWLDKKGVVYQEDMDCGGKKLNVAYDAIKFRFVVQNPTNRGYAGGCNDGISVAKTLFPEADILITNNDMELFPECIEELVKASETTPDAGVIGGRLMFPDGRIQHAGAFIGVFGWGQHKMAGVPNTECIETAITEQEYVTGALFYITNRCLKVVPCMDERFNPAYFEEVDYCTMARTWGFKTYYQPSARAVHYENKTANATFGSPEAVSGLSRFNQIKFYTKHDADILTYKPTSDRQALISGKIYGDWSFSIVLRNLAKGLKRNGVDVAIAPEEYHQPMPVDDWEIKEMILKPHDYWNRAILRSAEGDHQYLMPPGKRRVAHTTFEGTNPPQRWIEQLNHVDRVVVNSTFCKNILLERGVRTDITVVPNPVDTTLFNPQAKPLEIENRRKFGFLAMSAYGERKNLEAVIKAFILEFKPSEDVFLSLHSLSLFYILQQAQMDLKTWITNILGGQELPHAPIYVTSNSFHPTVVPSMYTAHDCFVMPSRCEGFGNGIVEAGACGIPSIATNYSGMTDFLHESSGFPIEFDLEPMPLQVLPYFRNYIGSVWATPRLDHLRSLMRYAFEHPEVVKQKGQIALQRARRADIVPVGKILADVMFD